MRLKVLVISLNRKTNKVPDYDRTPQKPLPFQDHLTRPLFLMHQIVVCIDNTLRQVAACAQVAVSLQLPPFMQCTHQIKICTCKK